MKESVPNDELTSMLTELNTVVQEQTDATQNIKRLLTEIYAVSPRKYDIYRMPDGEIVIDGGKHRRRVFVFCLPNGGVHYIGWAGETRHSKTTPNINSMMSSDGHLQEETLLGILQEMDLPPVQ